MKITKRYYKILPRSKQQETLTRRKKVEVNEITTPCTLFLDQASNTGFSLYDNDSRIVMSGVLERGRQRLYDYKKDLVSFVLDLVEEYKVTTIFHEEVYDHLNMETTETLFYLKHAIKDLGYEDEDLKVMGLSHKTWKSLLAKPNKFNFGKDDKLEVRKWVGEIYPLLALTKQDEFDAVGMGIAMMIKDKGKKNFYRWAKYNKRLPIHTVLYKQVFEDIDDVRAEDLEEYIQERVNKMRIAYRRGYEIGGLHELDLDRRKEVFDSIRQFLSHVDGLVYIKIPRDYKYWGMLMLLHGNEPAEFEDDNTDGSYYILACRKNRL